MVIAKTYLKPFLFISFLILLAVSCSSHHKVAATTSHGKQETVTVKEQPFSTTLYYSGIIQPLKTVVITSPADGVIQEMMFHFGDEVKPNNLLFTISSEKFQSDYKTALMQYIKSKNEYNTNHNQLEEGKFLHKNQLISDDEYKTKESAFYNAQLALIQAQEVLHNMLKQLSVQGFSMDDLTIENIDKITQALNAQGDSQKLRISAPASGVVLLPTKTDNESESKKIGKGDQVKQGDVLAVIGDTTGLTIRVNVNEFNINQLKIGQKVKVTGAAFPDFVLSGEISGIDHQAQSGTNGIPSFPIEVVVPTLTKQQQDVIHVGMSAKVEIDVEGDPQITVPINAVTEKNGQAFVNVEDPKTKKIHEISVKTGQTTADSVVIAANLKEGDKIVIPR